MTVYRNREYGIDNTTPDRTKFVSCPECAERIPVAFGDMRGHRSGACPNCFDVTVETIITVV